MTLVLAGLRKLWTRTATMVALIVGAIIVAAEFLLIGVSLSLPSSASGQTKESLNLLRDLLTFPGAYYSVMAILFVFGGLVAMIYFASVAGSEWSWGTLKVAVMRGESRSRYVLATFGSLSIVLLVGTVLVFLAGVAGAAGGALLGHVGLDGLTDASELPIVAVTLLRCWIALLSICAGAYAIAMIARSPMAAVGVVVGLYLLSAFGPAILQAALPEAIKEVLKYLPFSVASDAIALGRTTASERPVYGVEPTLAMIVTLGWLFGSLAVAAIATERAEISG